MLFLAQQGLRCERRVEIAGQSFEDAVVDGESLDVRRFKVPRQVLEPQEGLNSAAETSRSNKVFVIVAPELGQPRGTCPESCPVMGRKRTLSRTSSMRWKSMKLRSVSKIGFCADSRAPTMPAMSISCAPSPWRGALLAGREAPVSPAPCGGGAGRY
nr:hypothetical protein [uncultured bacterium]